MVASVSPPSSLAEPQRVPLSRLLALAIFGEAVAARTYRAMARIKPEFNDLLQRFAAMEAQHATWFARLAKDNELEADREFAEKELGYLTDQVDRYSADNDFDALVVLQGFIVESLAISTYEPAIDAQQAPPEVRAVFEAAAKDERYHVSWVTKYLQLRFFDDQAGLLALAKRVNVQGVDCVGGSLMNIAGYLSAVGIPGSVCTGLMADNYAAMLEAAGVPSQQATAEVVSVLAPLMRKLRRGDKIK